MPSPAALQKILVVEDDPVSRIALAGLLGRIPGAQVVQAENGLVAWDLLCGGLRPAVCCSDIRMPGLDGLALMERARAHPVLSHLPVILITGASDRQTVQQAITHRAAGYIVKPFVGLDTLNTVQRVMRESLTRQAEQPATTRARLKLDRAGLSDMLSTLREDAVQEQRRQDAGADESSLPARLTRLRSACLTLGLWTAAAMIKLPLPGPQRRAELLAVLAEVARAAQGQLDRLAAEPAPPRPSRPAPLAPEGAA